MNKPELTCLTTGDSFKVFRTTGMQGMQMPKHLCTGEAVVIVKKGSANLIMESGDHWLQNGDVFVIPARKAHALALESDFEANVIMPVNASIEFVAD